MIGFLRGASRKVGSSWVVEASGTGWKITSPDALVDGADVAMFVTTHVREDAIVLYAFAHEDDQAVFEALVKVSGVGPASAIALVRDLGSAGLRTAIQNQDVKAISKVKGIGATGASRILTMAKLPEGPSEVAVPSVHKDALDVLEALGYDRGAARIALAAIDSEDTSVLVRGALELL